jgi:hypothetical protein
MTALRAKDLKPIIQTTNVVVSAITNVQFLIVFQRPRPNQKETLNKIN